MTNFRGIEIKHFSAEIARLALVIAEYQADVLYRGQQEAIDDLLPLSKENWIRCGNALRVDWLEVCPQEEHITETFICGNPPYKGAADQTRPMKDDMEYLLKERIGKYKSLDYVCGWFVKAVDYGESVESDFAFVATNSVSQGQHIPNLWPLILETGYEISFAHTSFKWANLAAKNAGVIVVVIGLSKKAKNKNIYSFDQLGMELVRSVDNINPYLIPSNNVIIQQRRTPISALSEMTRGNDVLDGGNLLLSYDEYRSLLNRGKDLDKYVKRIYGSAELLRGIQRFCLWINDEDSERARHIPSINERITKVEELRVSHSSKKIAEEAKKNAHRFIARRHSPRQSTYVIPKVSSENRHWMPVGIIDQNSTLTDLLFFLKDSEAWNMSILSSRLHTVWAATVCGKMKTDFRYSNTLGWNTYPIPNLTEKNKEDLARCAEDILLARESHFPATIAELYKPDQMPDNLRQAHERNDEVLERIYIGRKFKNDTERLEKLFEMYTKMIAKEELEGAK